MNLILRSVFEWVIGNYTLFENPLYDYIAMAIIGAVAFIIAWIFVGILYGEDIINIPIVGSIIHWIVRLVVFVFIFMAVSVVIWIIKFVFSIPLWIWVFLIVSIMVIGAVLIKKFIIDA